MDREDLVARFNQLAGEARAKRPRPKGREVKHVASVNERRLMEAYRLLMNVNQLGALRHEICSIRSKPALWNSIEPARGSPTRRSGGSSTQSANGRRVRCVTAAM